MILWIILAIAIILVIYLVATYNGLVTMRNRVDEAWSDITVQLKRRADLIPNLVNTVKGYAAHESGVFENVVKAREMMLNAQGVADTAKAENQLQDTLKSLFAVAENYPDLKASQNFAELQRELVDTEDKIQGSRRFYNGGVRDYNTKIDQFPNNIFAGMFKFTKREFFEVEDRASIEQPVEALSTRISVIPSLLWRYLLVLLLALLG